MHHIAPGLSQVAWTSTNVQKLDHSNRVSIENEASCSIRRRQPILQSKSPHITWQWARVTEEQLREVIWQPGFAIWKLDSCSMGRRHVDVEEGHIPIIGGQVFDEVCCICWVSIGSLAIRDIKNDGRKAGRMLCYPP